jgi:hypothetical protein
MSEECLDILDKWLILIKKEFYDKHINKDNDENELQTYSDSLEDYGENLIQAIEKESYETLKNLNWPEELMKCIKDLSIRVDIINDITSSFIRFPFNRSEIHRKELLRENAGLQ